MISLAEHTFHKYLLNEQMNWRSLLQGSRSISTKDSNSLRLLRNLFSMVNYSLDSNGSDRLDKTKQSLFTNSSLAKLLFPLFPLSSIFSPLNTILEELPFYHDVICPFLSYLPWCFKETFFYPPEQKCQVLLHTWISLTCPTADSIF